MRALPAIACAVALLLTGCNRTPRVPDLGTAGTDFDPIAFFDGHVRSWGVMEDRSAAPTGWVVTDCEGHLDGPDRLHMVQHLSFQDAPAQHRTWTLWRTGPRHFEATASDMIGAAKGEVTGRTFHWTWVLTGSSGGSPVNLTMEQWMYRLDDGSVMIRTTIGKFGIILKQVSERFSRTNVPPAGRAEK